MPTINAIASIRKRRRETGNLTAEEDVENKLTEDLNKVDETLPTIEQLQLINTTKASMILTEIQNGLVSKVKLEQINLKKKAKNELKDILDELDRLNKELTSKLNKHRRE